jgi:putative heme-binding domain-containing protein
LIETYRMNRRFLLLLGGFAITVGAVLAQQPPAGPDPKTKGLDAALRNLRAVLEPTPALPPGEALMALRPQAGFNVELLANEPDVRQPLYINFDERGRMWVMQYRQYPFPAGLKILEYDRYIRAKFDKVPLPPPNHFRGADLISIHEDSNGDGRFDRQKTFVDGLNIATAALPGRGGVWVMNPPYLLFYPDRNRDDVPDGPPEVHLSGFGLEDTHAVASSLCWGPDGWIYGAQGSTCTAKVRVEITKATTTTDFLGQCIWRYHPESHQFEIFAEGGGNTFGVAFDDQGRVYSGTNWGKFRGLHYVQGGYYVKGWGKHGPLTNPYALGYFEHMPHEGNAERLTHTFIVYGETAFPDSFHGAIIGPSALQRRVHVTKLHPAGSSFHTTEEPFLLTSSDGWFRPVDLKAGPDGALYVADMYEPRINHVDPRDNWHRDSGRIYRIRPVTWKPVQPFDLGKQSTDEVVRLLEHPSRWWRDMAKRILGDRKDSSAHSTLRKMLNHSNPQTALEALWTLHLCGGLDESTTVRALAHADPHVRRWAVRLTGDAKQATATVGAKLAELAASEKNPEVRSQLASSAKRLPATIGLPIVWQLLRRSEDRNDVHIPLLNWWAIEAKAESNRDDILRRFEDPGFWRLPMVDAFVVERLTQRYATAGGAHNLLACARLLQVAPDDGTSGRVLTGLDKAFAGRVSPELPQELTRVVSQALARDQSARFLSLGVRTGYQGAVETALGRIKDEKVNATQRVELVRLFGEVPQLQAVGVLLDCLADSKSAAIQREALTALMRYDDARIASTVIDRFNDHLTDAAGLRVAALELLTSRPAWVGQFLTAIESGRISARAVPLDTVRRLQDSRDKVTVGRVQKLWGTVRAATASEKRQQMEHLAAVLKPGTGDVVSGKKQFAGICGKCHRLFGEGADVGPDLTGYERDNLGYWLENIVDPSAVIRDEYMTFKIDTIDGRCLTGIIAAQDKAVVTLRTPDGRVIRIARDQIEDMAAVRVSLMPEDVLKGLTNEQIRDLFAYLMSKTAKR